MTSFVHVLDIALLQRRIQWTSPQGYVLYTRVLCTGNVFFFGGGGVEWGGVGTYFEALTTVTRDVKFAMSKVTTDV